MVKNVLKTNSKCSVLRTKTGQECFSMKDLEYLTKLLNKCKKKCRCTGETLKISRNKNELLKMVSRDLKEPDPSVWITKKFLKRSYLETDVFKPRGPLKFNAWLSNFEISKAINQYVKLYSKYTHPLNFVFHGAVSSDWFKLNPSLYKNFVDKKRQAVIFNTAKESHDGSHWIAVFIDGKNIEFFDSNGDGPNKDTLVFLNNIKKILGTKIIKINKIKHQFTNGVCGLYAIKYVIHRLFRLDTFRSFTTRLQPDTDIENLRRQLFI